MHRISSMKRYIKGAGPSAAGPSAAGPSKAGPTTSKAGPTTSKAYSITDEYKTLVLEHSYLGKKGYTIQRSIITPTEEAFLRDDLLMKPFAPPGTQQTNKPFPVFRENANKFYLPRFYGIQRYGMPTKSEIDVGDTISVPFAKPLRDYQDKIVDTYTDYVTQQSTGAILEVPCGRGKCLAKDTPIIMYDGTIKKVQDIQIGDQLMGDDSTPRTALTLARGQETMVRIKELGAGSDTDRATYTVNMSHILSLKHSITGQVLNISVQDYLSHPDKDVFYGYRVPIQFPEVPVDLDPYDYGYISADTQTEPLRHEYICNSRYNQLQLIAGIMDNMTTGCISDFEYSIYLGNAPYVLPETVLFVLRSLGFAVMVSHTEQHTVLQLWNTDTVSINDIPLRQRRNTRENITLRSSLSYPIQCTVLEQGDYYGFELDGNRRFVLGDFTVTHNTVMALKIISVLQKKTLIIVHKEFLMNQWVERIGEFLPTARVGKIQGPVADTQDKDIVIGMVQTLYDKEYPPTMFSSFGLTVIDEVHRIGSEQFSRTLMKTITHYMLGISATVERKDGLAKVLYMFIGEKIYSETREQDDLVSVRAIQFQTKDAEFNETELDFRGKPKFSTMISKLCDYGPRSTFIVRVLRDLLKESENQIMVLCHNRSLLTVLFDAVMHYQLATVGYYVGGMKQANLQETEEKQIVLATYAMAAEALDIKTLATLVLVTPRTDVIQSVGRILRVKHDNPIIVDIVDAHGIFQNQWAQRRRYYKKCNYHIAQVESERYLGMDEEQRIHWKTVFHPKSGATRIDDSEQDDKDDIVPLNERKCLVQLDEEHSIV